MQVDRPIFVVSMPRSGSTALHRVMAAHPDLATTSHASRRSPTWAPGIRFFRAVYYRRDALSEGGRIWDRFQKHGHDVMEAQDVTPAARRFFRRTVETHLRLFRRERFLARCPRLALRVNYFREIFPEAKFIHLVRDGRAVCRSVMRVWETSRRRTDRWDVKPPGWEQHIGDGPIGAAAFQWRELVNYAETQGKAMGPGRFLTVTYESLVKEPDAVLGRIGAFCGLDCPHPAQREQIDGLGSRNYKWREAFTGEQVQTLNELLGPAMERFGYRS